MKSSSHFRGAASCTLLLLVLLAVSFGTSMAGWCGTLCAPRASAAPSHACCENSGDSARQLAPPVCTHAAPPVLALADTVVPGRDRVLVVPQHSASALLLDEPGWPSALVVTGAASPPGIHPALPLLALRI